MSLFGLPLIKKLPDRVQNFFMIMINKISYFLYIITGEKIIITPEMLIIGHKNDICK